MKLRGLRTDRRTFAKLLKIIGDDQRATGKTALDNPAIAELRAECDVIQMNRIVGSNGIDLLLALQLGDCCLWDQNRVVANLRLCLHPAELART